MVDRTDILTSIHGRQAGLNSDDELVVNGKVHLGLTEEQAANTSIIAPAGADNNGGIYDADGNKISVALSLAQSSRTDVTGVVASTASGKAVSASGGMVAANVFTPQMYKFDAGQTNGVGDDTAAISWAIAQAVACNGSVDLGYGVFRVTAPIGTLITAPISISGRGVSNTWIVLDKDLFSGDLISFSNTWFGSDTTKLYSGSNGVGSDITVIGWAGISSRKSGVELSNFSVIGDRTTSQTQNGVMFYDRNDAVRMAGVEVQTIKGIGLGLSGFPSNPASNAACLMRESVIQNCQTRWCGDTLTARPSVVFNCNSKTLAQAGGSTTNIFDDTNNYNIIKGLKVIFPEGIGFQSNCHNLNVEYGANEMHDNVIDVLVDTMQYTNAAPNSIPGALVNSGYTSITNGVLTIASGASVTKMDGTSTGNIAVGTYMLNAQVPSGTYIESVLTGSGGIGTYQLRNKNVDLSTFTVSSGSIGSCRFSIPAVQFGGGHAAEKVDVVINSSNVLGSNSVGVEFNQNPLSAAAPKTKMSQMNLSVGKIDFGVLLTSINSMAIRWGLRNPTTPVTVLSITQSVTINLLGAIGGGEIAIAGTKTNLHVYPDGQRVVYGTSIGSVMNAAKWPNCFMYLHNAGTLTRWVSDGTSWVAA